MNTTEVATVARLRLAATRLARRMRQHASDGGTLSPSRLSALTTIQRRGPLRLGELADKERISKPSITRIVGRLEAAGLVQRLPDPEDGRSTRISLTPAGEQVLAATAEGADLYLMRQFAALTAEERETLNRAIPVLERLLEVKT